MSGGNPKREAQRRNDPSHRQSPPNRMNDPPLGGRKEKSMDKAQTFFKSRNRELRSARRYVRSYAPAPAMRVLGEISVNLDAEIASAEFDVSTAFNRLANLVGEEKARETIKKL